MELLAHRGFPDEAKEFCHWIRADSSSTCAIALKNGRRCIEPDVANSEQLAGTEDQKIYLAAGIRAVQSTPLFSRSGKLLGMISTHWNRPHQPGETELRNLDILARQAADIIERRETEQMIRKNQAWLAAQKQALQAGLSGASLEESLGLLVKSSIQHYGLTTRAAFYLANRDGKALSHLVGMGPKYAKHVDGVAIGPDSFACGLAIYLGKPILTTDVRQEALWENWLGIAERFDFRACGSFPLLTSEGKALGTFAVYWRQPHEATREDVAFANAVADAASILVARHIEAEERRRAEEHRLMLVHELDHRVKNTLAVISAMCSRMAVETDSVENFVKALQGRIGALAEAHRQLSLAMWRGTKLRTLVEKTVAPHGAFNGRHVSIKGPDIFLTAKITMTLALVFHELSTNAVKYGALSPGAHGGVAIEWFIVPDGSNRLHIQWTERGGPRIDPQMKRKPGFGSSLIQRSVEYELDGAFEALFEPQGLTCRIALAMTPEIGFTQPEPGASEGTQEQNEGG